MQDCVQVACCHALYETWWRTMHPNVEAEENTVKCVILQFISFLSQKTVVCSFKKLDQAKLRVKLYEWQLQSVVDCDAVVNIDDYIKIQDQESPQNIGAFSRQNESFSHLLILVRRTPSKPRLSPAATMSDDTPSALTPPLHCASILQPAAPPQVVAFES